MRPLRDDALKSDSEILGRNTWMLWCGGNEQFWGEWLSNNSHGFLDFLKLVDSRNRSTRWRDAGMVNEPGMRQAAAPDQFGLWLDQSEDPRVNAYRKTLMQKALDGKFYTKADGFNGFEEPDYVPGVPPAQVYGFSSGIIGLRLFPNPNFAAKKGDWNAERFYNDPSYYSNPKLERPYLVGMSCAFCHATAHPLNPPPDKVNPRWDNLSGNIGNQYLRIRAVFGNQLTKDSFFYHLLDSQPPGTIDTSLVASDNINNPNTMNAIFGVPARVARAFQNPQERLDATAAKIDNVWSKQDASQNAYRTLIPNLSQGNDNPRFVPRILLDGADSVGAQAALARVYLNIGTYSEQWIRLHEPLIGFLPPRASTDADLAAGRTQLPFKIEDCENNSVYWLATRKRVPALRDYFLKVTPKMPLLDARSNDTDVTSRVDLSKLARGRKVFATNCIVCHSSIQPESGSAFLSSGQDQVEYEKTFKKVIDARRDAYNPLVETGDGYGNTSASSSSPQVKSWALNHEMWDHDPGHWLRDPDYKTWAEYVVELPDFWKQNFLSTDYRVPITLIGTNSARAMATNGMTGHMWEDFSSSDYRSMPSVGSIEYFDPFSKTFQKFEPRHKVLNPDVVEPGGGGPGFYRPPSLISVWATAPLLHNNSLGHFNNDPSVKGRLEAFDDAIHKLLYPERRLLNSDYATPEQLQRDQGLIWRTPCETWIEIRGTDVPLYLRRLPLPAWLLQFGESLSGMGQWRAIIPLLLILVAFSILFQVRGSKLTTRWWRYGAYGLISFGLFFGFVAYLDDGGFGNLRIGPIPAGTPVDLISNINPDAPKADIKRALRETLDGITEIQDRHLTGADKQKVIDTKIGPALMKVSKCPDFVMDKGHYYPWFYDMTPDDKEALIELLKTF